MRPTNPLAVIATIVGLALGAGRGGAVESSYDDLVDSLDAQSQLIEQLLVNQESDSRILRRRNVGPRITPGWSVEADAVFMTRSRAAGLAVAEQQFAPNDVLLNAADFGFNYEVGPRIQLTRHTRTGCDVELTYFGIDAWNDQIVFSEPVFILTENANFGIAGEPNFRYGSELYSGELNVTSPQRGMFRVLAGARILELNEAFIGDNATLPDFYAIQTSNQLYGFQLGADIAPINLERFAFHIRAKGGPFHNNVRVDATHFGTFNGSDRGRNLTFVGELALTGVVHLTDWLSVRGGYQLMLVDDVALAVDQFSRNDPVANTVEIVDGASLLYHGGFGGLDIRW